MDVKNEVQLKSSLHFYYNLLLYIIVSPSAALAAQRGRLRASRPVPSEANEPPVESKSIWTVDLG